MFKVVRIKTFSKFKKYLHQKALWTKMCITFDEASSKIHLSMKVMCGTQLRYISKTKSIEDTSSMFNTLFSSFCRSFTVWLSHSSLFVSLFGTLPLTCGIMKLSLQYIFSCVIFNINCLAYWIQIMTLWDKISTVQLVLSSHICEVTKLTS